MKIPTEPEGNGYYNHDAIIHYESDNSESSSEDEIEPPNVDGDFSEYLWMENIEEFDNQVLKQLEEEELMQQCIEAMLEDEREDQSNGSAPNCNPWDPSLTQAIDLLSINDELAKDSKLNPEATEFVPRQRETASVEVKA